MDKEKWQKRGEGHRERLRERFLKGGIERFSDGEVVEFLLNYVTLRGEEPRTVDFSPFPDEESVDRSPVVRSFLLQQLLKYE